MAPEELDRELAVEGTIAADPHEMYRSSASQSHLYERAPVGLFFVDVEMRFRRVNERFAEMDGVTVEGHIGRPLPEVLGETGVTLANQFHRALKDKGARGEEFEVRVPAGTTTARHWQISHAPVTINDEVVGVDVVIHDVTDRRSREIRASFLSRAGQMLDSSLDYRATLKNVARLAVPEIADWCSISMLDDRGRMFRLAVAHSDSAKDQLAQELIEREALPFSAPAGAARVASTARKQVIDDFADELLEESLNDPRSLEILRSLGIGSMISVPLEAHGRILGALTLLGERPGRFDEDDVRLAEELANRAAVSIDNARIYTTHTRIAHTLQAGLMPPPLPPIGGLELAALYRPAGELVEVGGDFYDAYLRPNGEWLIVIGDVTGKGAEAAASTALIRYTLRAAAQHPGGTADLLGELNTAMLAQGSDYCTIGLVGVGASPSGRMEISVCLGGHPLPILLCADGTTAAVGTAGTLLGYSTDARFHEDRITLDGGEILLLYTDGLTEASAPPGWSQEELGALLSRAPQDNLEELLSTLEARAIEGAEGHPRDDIAMLAMRLAGDGPTET